MVQNVPPAQAWEALRDDPDARLVDVRTDAEWNYVGVPDLSGIGKELALVPWQVFPSMARNAGFLDGLRAAGIGPEHAVYFVCRSGVRSLHAAQAAAQAGYARVFNVADGFEGPHDEAGHRGTRAGWKADGLPWRQG
jgi:rhodanese-related sulfurtransferase